MNWYQIFYLVSLGDGLIDFFDTLSNWMTFFAIVSFIFYLVMWIVSVASYVDDNGITDDIEYAAKAKGFRRLRRFSGFMFWGFLLLTIISWLAYVAIPTKKESLLIIAGGGAMQYLTTDSVGKQLPKEAMTFVVTELRQLSKEAKVELGIASEKDKILEQVKSMSADEVLAKMKVDSNFANIVLGK